MARREAFDFQRCIDDFRRDRPRWERFTETLRRHVDHTLKQLDVGGFVECRTKDAESFALKVANPTKRYRDPLSDVTDLAGIRIVVRTLAEVERVEGSLTRILDIDWTRSSNKIAESEPSRFGYASKHLIIRAQPGLVSDLTEFAGMFAEIQLRTFLQHTWATVFRALGYKHENDIPARQQRRLFTLSAMFELADAELDIAWRASRKLPETTAPLSTSKTEAAPKLSYVAYARFIDDSPELDEYCHFLGVSGWTVARAGLLSPDIDLLAATGVVATADLNRTFDITASWTKPPYGGALRVGYVSGTVARW